MTHPLTPPPELVRKWCAHSNKHETYDQFWNHIATRAAQWGADQELEAVLDLCDEYLTGETLRYIRATRRPKPPSLKKQALAILAGVAVHELYGGATADNRLSADDMSTIRRALEALSDD